MGQLLRTKSQYISLDRLLSTSNNFLITHYDMYRQHIFGERSHLFETCMHKVTITWLHHGSSSLPQGGFARGRRPSGRSSPIGLEAGRTASIQFAACRLDPIYGGTAKSANRQQTAVSKLRRSITAWES
jgi:hypothetical protein